jgi:RNA polymerase-binding transcription factor DksA
VTDSSPEPTPESTPDVLDAPDTSRTPAPEVDLDSIERDLAGVERALERLSDGTYWTDEVTGAPIPEQVLADDPTARRA